ncbi:MAG: tetratricopeptide repeat protein [Deltaproteobacteria bacterium]|nr:tetratricopeptide repeat protein [Deltaproteobacteria bacterium]
MWSKLWRAAWFAPLTLASCATSSAVEQDLSLLRRQVAALERSVRELDASLRRIDDQVTLLGAGNRAHAPREVEVASPDTGSADSRDVASSRRGGTPRETAAMTKRSAGATPPSSALPARRHLPVVHFRPAGAGPTAVVADDDAALPPESLDSGQPPILIKLGPSSSSDDERIPVDRDVLRRPDPVLGSRARPARTEPARTEDGTETHVGAQTGTGAGSAPDVDGRGNTQSAKRAGTGTDVDAQDVSERSIKAEYERALGLLRDEDRPKSALTAFLSLGPKSTRSKLADNVAYWTGECQFALGEYGEAIRQFERTVRDFPRSPKVPYALLGVAEGWLKLDKTKKARRILRRVIQTYPGSDAASRARARLSSLGEG